MRVSYFSKVIVGIILRLTDDEIDAFVSNKQLNRPDTLLDSVYWADYDVWKFKGTNVKETRQYPVPGNFIGVRDIAQALSITEPTLRKRIKAGTFPKPDIIYCSGLYYTNKFLWRESLVYQLRRTKSDKK